MAGNKPQCKNVAEFVKAFGEDGKAFGYLQGKVTAVNEKDVTSSKTGESYHIAELTVEDSTGSVKIGIFNPSEQWSVGDSFNGNALVASEFQGEMQLKATKDSKIGKATAKPTTTKATTKATGSTSGAAAGKTGGDSDIVKALNALGEKVVNAITEAKVAILDQLKEVIKARFEPQPSDQPEDQDEPGSEEPPADDSEEADQSK